VSGAPGRAPLGYAHQAYAESFSEFGTPRHLAGSGGWILERPIQSTTLRDGMGCYPLFACPDWNLLPDDLPALASDLVSLTLVTDPFGNFDEDLLRRCFDIVRPYKQHYVTDVDRIDTRAMRRNHRRNIAKARASVHVEVCLEPTEHAAEFVELFAELRRRHRIGGIRALTPLALRRQLDVPGLVLFRATAAGAVVGLLSWYVDSEVAYAHLAASSPLGYELLAAYALYDRAVEHLRERVRWLDLGASPGVERERSGSGLRTFKRGWSTGMRPVYLCGRIFQPDAYAELSRARGESETAYFPSYRAGEFG
jgi:Acetyltransferase (GNAT) domain